MTEQQMGQTGEGPTRQGHQHGHWQQRVEGGREQACRCLDDF